MKNYIKPVLNNFIFKNIIFVIIYFIVITPIALILRLLSINTLEMKYSDKPSYWEDKK